MDAESRVLVRSSNVPSVEHTPGGVVRFFHGHDHGFGDITVATSMSPVGGGAREHRHPCVELFVVTQGQGTYGIDGLEFVAEVGDVVMVPAGAWHSFSSTGDVPLRHVSAFPSGRVESELPGSLV